MNDGHVLMVLCVFESYKMNTHTLKEWLEARHMPISSLFYSAVHTHNSSLLCSVSMAPSQSSGKHSLHPSGVSVQTSYHWTQQWEFGRRMRVISYFFFFLRRTTPQWCQGVKTLPQQCSVSARVTERSCHLWGGCTNLRV